MLSLYEVLAVRPDATTDEVKAAYHALLLKLHPDKHATVGERYSATQQFHRVQRAWEVLRDPALRDVHDRELAQAELHGIMTYQDELEVEDMEVCQESRSYTYGCRCGDVYSLSMHEAQAVQACIAIPCKELFKSHPRQEQAQRPKPWLSRWCCPGLPRQGSALQVHDHDIIRSCSNHILVRSKPSDPNPG